MKKRCPKKVKAGVAPPALTKRETCQMSKNIITPFPKNDNPQFNHFSPLVTQAIEKFARATTRKAKRQHAWTWFTLAYEHRSVEEKSNANS